MSLLAYIFTIGLLVIAFCVGWLFGAAETFERTSKRNRDQWWEGH